MHERVNTLLVSTKHNSKNSNYKVKNCRLKEKEGFGKVQFIKLKHQLRTSTVGNFFLPLILVISYFHFKKTE